MPRRATGLSQKEIIRSKEEMITEDKVEGVILDRVMRRLEGQNPADEVRNATEQEEKLRQEVEKIRNAGKELTGIARSIKALISHFNATLEEYGRGDAPAIKTNHDEFRSCFSCDLPKLEKLIQSEIDYRSELLDQQAEFDDFIKQKVESFMEAKREMEEQFLAQYQTMWMKQQLALNNPDIVGQWEPRLEKMTAFGQAIRPDGKFAFEWPTEYQVSYWNLDRKIQLQRISTNWTSLRCIQLHFTNDISSEPLDTGYRSEPDIFKEFMLNVVPPPGQQKTVPITEIGVKLTGEMQIYGLRIKYATGDYYTMFESPDGNWKAKQIPQGKEIIGLYGDFDDTEERINTLGFILWTPNPQAI